MKSRLIIGLIIGVCSCFCAQSLENDSLRKINYKKYYDCDYKEGNILILIKKGNEFKDLNDFKESQKGYIIRMEAVYSLEFTDGKRYEMNVVKKITQDSIAITNFFNENAAKVAGQKFGLISYPLSSLKYIRFVNDRSLSIYRRKNIQKDYNILIKNVDHAKLCPAVLTFKSRNGEVKVCHFYLTDQGYNILYEDEGKVYYLEDKVEWK